MKPVMQNRQSQGFWQYGSILMLLVMTVMVNTVTVWADPTTPKTYFSTAATSLALDTYHNRLYLGTSGVNNVYSLVLDSNGDTTLTNSSFPFGTGTACMSLDAVRNRLYIAGNATASNPEVFAINLDTSGDILGGANYTSINTSTSAAKALALDAKRNRLYVGLASATIGLAVVALNLDGDLVSFGTQNTNRVNAMVLDAARNKLYLGYNTNQVGTCSLDVNGDILSVNTTQTVGTSNVTTMALDSVRNCLYVATDGDTNIYTFSLDASGEVLSGPSSFAVSNYVSCLTLDAARNRLYFGAGALTNSLRFVALDALGVPTGTVSSVASSGAYISGIALDTERQRLYSISSSNPPNYYFQLSDPAMTFLQINNGAATTTSTSVELEWSLPNAQFIRVENTSDLVNYTFPVTSTANTIFNEWISTGNKRWSNDTSTRANPLLVNATLSSGTGPKTVRVWFWEDAGSNNTGSVIHYRTASITLNAIGTATFTPTFTVTPSITPTGSFTMTASSTLTATPSHTPSSTSTCTFTATWTPTMTFTPTATPTQTATMTATPTHTPSMTSTATPSHTPSSTRTETLTATSTQTMTFTPTVTATQTATMTATRTHTPSMTSTATFTQTLTPTPSVTLTQTPTRTGTPTITPSVTESYTVTRTPSYSPTVTITATRTVSATLTTTPSQSPTLTITPTRTNTSTATVSPTITNTRTITQTITFSPTITMTSSITPSFTITSTLPPTATPTPMTLFFLDKNRFTPNSEMLTMKVGLIAGEKGTVTIVTLLGKKVRQFSLASDLGEYLSLVWNGKNENGEAVASGIYFILYETNQKRIVRKVLVIR